MRYLVIDWDRPLGDGGEGAVYLGQFTDGQLCAVKVPQRGMHSLLKLPGFHAVARRQLEHEVDRYLRLSGDRHIKLLAVNLDAEIPFIALEYAPNGTLRHEMRALFGRGLVYPVTQALERACDLLLALHESHVGGIIHRDVKPENLLMFGETIKLGDFGVGRTLLRPTMMRTQALVGTALYASPEQLSMPLLVTAKSDLFSVGVVLYEMLMGIVPDVNCRAFLRVANYRNDITARLDALLSALLAFNPHQRPQSAFDAYRMAKAAQFEYLLRNLGQTLQ